MRIALLTRGFPPANPYGIARVRELLAREMVRSGHEVVVFTTGSALGVEARDGYRICRVPVKPAQYYFPDQPAANAMLTYSQSVCEAVEHWMAREAAFDILDAPLWEVEGFAALVRFETLPVVIRVETTSRQVYEINGIPLDHRREFEFELERLCLRGADGVLYDSDSVRQETARLYGGGLVRGVEAVTHYGCPLPEPVTASAVATTPQVLTVGRLEKRKGTLHLFEVIARVAAQIPTARFRIVASDNSAHDGFRAETGGDYPAWFRRRWPDLVDRVDFLGSVSSADLEREYQSAQVCLVPSVYESFGLAYIEAMSYGKPVVAFDVGGAREIVTHDQDGVLVPPGDEAAMAEAVVALLRDGDRRRRLGRAGRETVEARFTDRHMARAALDFYETLLRERGGAAESSRKRGMDWQARSIR